MPYSIIAETYIYEVMSHGNFSCVRLVQHVLFILMSLPMVCLMGHVFSLYLDYRSLFNLGVGSVCWMPYSIIAETSSSVKS